MTSNQSGGPSPGRKQRLLLRIERISRTHWRAVFLVTVAVVAVSLWFGSGIELESDVLNLIPEGNPRVDAFRDALADFGSIDLLIVLLEAGEHEGPDELEDFADLFAERLEEREELIEFVEYRIDLEEGFMELFYENALLYLEPERLPELAAKLSDEGIRHKLQDNRRALQASPAGTLEAELISRDPLDLMPLLLDRFLKERSSLDVDLSSGSFLSRDNRTLIMFVKPTGASLDLEFNRTLLGAVRVLETETRETLSAEQGGEPVGVRARYGGNYALGLQESRLIRKDVGRNLWISLLAVSALYWLCYRRFAALLYSSLPLLVGQALTFGLAGLVLHELNAASSAFTALLMGLGTDFTIVMYARYVEERQKGKSLAEASAAMVGQTGLGVFTGAITSAGTFYAMCISQFRGLFDLGFLIGSGILLCAVAIVFLLPAMITWNESVRKRKVDAVRKLHLQSFGLEYLIPLAARYRRTVVVGTVLLVVGSGWAITRIEFDDSINTLRSNRTDASRVLADVAETFGASLSYMMAIAEGDTSAEAMARVETIHARLLPYVEDGTIGSYDSILTYVPPADRQRAILRSVAEEADDALDPDRIGRAFAAGIEESGFRAEFFAEYAGRLTTLLTPVDPVTLDDLLDSGLERLVSRYVAIRDGKVRIVTYFFPTDVKWKRNPPPGLIEAVTGGDERIVVTGTNVVGRELRGIFSRESRRAVGLGLALVSVLLLVDFRSLRLAAVAMAQLIVGVILMFGVMGLTGIHLNFVNAFVAVMILGVGIDYSIHLVHRMHWNGGRVDPGLLETGKAVVMASLTNIAGFGTLYLGSYPAIRSFGLVAVVGSLTCLFTALTLVPALMARKDAS
jgi:predicted RND superfamily exporter protein